MSNLNPWAASAGCGLAAEIIRRFGAVRVRVNGCSMLPMIAPGDVLIVRRRTAAQMTPGDIAVFTRYERLFAHRVAGKSSTGSECLLLTRGDTLPENDSPVPDEELLGQVTIIERGSKRLRVCAPAGWTLVLGGLARRSSGVLRAMGRLHGLRRRVRRGLLRLFPAIAATPEAGCVIEELCS